MTDRRATLQAFFTSMHGAIRARTAASDSAAIAAGKIFAGLERPEPAAPRPADRVPACRYIDDALSDATRTDHPAADHARALAALVPDLTWYTRPGSDTADDSFATSHANATIVGNGGLARCPNVRIGVSLLAPNVQYPDHRHPPEEIYVALSLGDWRQDKGPWHEPGPGGIVYNPPSILHAMRAGSMPLLATWCLWNG